MTAPTHHRRRDIKDLIRRARDYELRARLAKDSSERTTCTWFAKMFRAKAAALAKRQAPLGR
jgi:hypothetical protein